MRRRYGIDKKQLASVCYGIWPEAEHIPADRHSHKTCSVRGLLCRLSLLWTERRRGARVCLCCHSASVLAPSDTPKQPPFSFSLLLWLTHTLPFEVVGKKKKSSRGHIGSVFLSMLSPFSAVAAAALVYSQPLVNTFYLTASFYDISL